VPNTRVSSPVGLHRVIAPAGVLPQAAQRLDPTTELWPDEVRIRVDTLNLDAASYRQLATKHDGDGEAVRAEVLAIIRERGKMQNPVTGSGGMLIGTVEAVGPESRLGLAVGDRVASLVSLSLTPLQIDDSLRGWDGHSEQVPCDGTAILFGRSIAAVLPSDLPAALAMMVMAVAVIGGAGKSGSLSLAAARAAGAARTVGIVPIEREAVTLLASSIADAVELADARDPVALAAAVARGLDGPADITVVCVDVPGCEHGAILATAEGGTVIFFSMATSFSAAALGAEGLAADVTMLVGNGYTPGHAALALDLLRSDAGVRTLFEARLAAESGQATGAAG